MAMGANTTATRWSRLLRERSRCAPTSVVAMAATPSCWRLARPAVSAPFLPPSRGVDPRRGVPSPVSSEESRRGESCASWSTMACLQSGTGDAALRRSAP